MFLYIPETVPVEGPSKEAHMKPIEVDSFRPTQTVYDVIEPHSSGERGQTKGLKNTTELRTGKRKIYALTAACKRLNSKGTPIYKISLHAWIEKIPVYTSRMIITKM